MGQTRIDVSIYGIYGQISGLDKLVQLQAKFKNALEEAVLAENGVENNCRDAEISCPDSSAP
jgi:hypothetical protein